MWPPIVKTSLASPVLESIANGQHKPIPLKILRFMALSFQMPKPTELEKLIQR